ncbi:uncharacterized protein BDZ83DRAFT_653485 [Colletotrichum acutatum]|uniref:Uncharacterized protein n=1 Tax=Glomerella acutata TaxID=27357 RepID=A0AAD8XGW7_GLOAC|nr:uncharacterized protein BDZ83DRAFT_653485 [Colletotrichum acutatum]KAK1722925.1 hypothetical protein BDZ83DRAFT_653485 [Colletotrichum acutatum]
MPTHQIYAVSKLSVTTPLKLGPNTADMCQAWRYTFTCGHQSGEKWYDPENAEDCPEAVRANRRHRQYGTLLRCSPLSTASVSTQGVCSRDKCYAKEYLIPYGWWCHYCGYMNNAGYIRESWQLETDAILVNSPSLTYQR